MTNHIKTHILTILALSFFGGIFMLTTVYPSILFILLGIIALSAVYFALFGAIQEWTHN